MSGPVDVLAVMDRAIENLQGAGVIGNTIGMKSARAAVAELIEAARESIAADKRYGLGGASHDRLVAALDNITGATK